MSKLFSRDTLHVVAIASGVTLFCAPPSAFAAGWSGQSAKPVGAAGSIDPQVQSAITTLAGQITAEVMRHPPTSTVETFEAAILFVVDQSAQPANVVCAALGKASGAPNTPPNAQAAMNTVCRVFRRRSGTGALGSAGGNGFGGAAFGIPSISLGGGGSTYTNPSR